MGPHLSSFEFHGQQPSREVKLTITQACTTTQPRWEGCPATKGGRCPALSPGDVSPKLLYVDELEFVVHLLFIDVTEECHVVPFAFLYEAELDDSCTATFLSRVAVTMFVSSVGQVGTQITY